MTWLAFLDAVLRVLLWAAPIVFLVLLALYIRRRDLRRFRSGRR